ncbi:hypothetical protein [Bacillus testis]|uniref:hypothetical protein n=1 Tax=Bacillus testis TaxID=1622072 RepID=UPI00067F0C06|nr:hypothetical protein [Bacillus testis]
MRKAYIGLALGAAIFIGANSLGGTAADFYAEDHAGIDIQTGVLKIRPFTHPTPLFYTFQQGDRVKDMDGYWQPGKVSKPKKFGIEKEKGSLDAEIFAVSIKDVDFSSTEDPALAKASLEKNLYFTIIDTDDDIVFNGTYGELLKKPELTKKRTLDDQNYTELYSIKAELKHEAGNELQGVKQVFDIGFHVRAK